MTTFMPIPGNPRPIRTRDSVELLDAEQEEISNSVHTQYFESHGGDLENRKHENRRPFLYTPIRLYIHLIKVYTK